MLKILELRTRLSRPLAISLTSASFHDVVLMNGAVPMNVLEELVINTSLKSKARPSPLDRICSSHLRLKSL